MAASLLQQRPRWPICAVQEQLMRWRPLLEHHPLQHHPSPPCLRIRAAIVGNCLHSHPTTLQCSTGQEETWGKAPADDILEAPSDAQFQGPEAWKNLPPRITCSCDKRYMIVSKGKGGLLIVSFSLCKSDTGCSISYIKPYYANCTDSATWP